MRHALHHPPRESIVAVESTASEVTEMGWETVHPIAICWRVALRTPAASDSDDGTDRRRVDQLVNRSTIANIGGICGGMSVPGFQWNFSLSRLLFKSWSHRTAQRCDIGGIYDDFFRFSFARFLRKKNTNRRVKYSASWLRKSIRTRYASREKKSFRTYELSSYSCGMFNIAHCCDERNFEWNIQQGNFFDTIEEILWILQVILRLKKCLFLTWDGKVQIVRSLVALGC